MEDKDMLKRWLSNNEKRLEENKQELQELQENKEYDLKRYELYSSIISDWLNDVANENHKECMTYNLEFLKSQPENIEREIKKIQDSIEYDEFVVTKLKRKINN